MVGVVAVADDVALHLEHHLVEGPPLRGHATLADGVEHLARRLADGRPLREVARLRSFSRAAASLGYSQSAVTMQVQQLERRGYGLDDRTPQGAELAERGEAFSFPTRASSSGRREGPSRPCATRRGSAAR